MTDDSVEARITESLRCHHGAGLGTVPWDRVDYLHAFGNVRGALLYSTLFVPELIEVEGCVFLKDIGIYPPGGWEEVAARIRVARKTSPEALKELVDSCNWVEVPYLFSDRSGSTEEDEALAQVIVQAWRARLKDRFPDRCFAVHVLDSLWTGDPGVVGVGFEELPGPERGQTIGLAGPY